MQYVEIETVPEQKQNKILTGVQFDSDYDVTDALRLWGNWARKELYDKQSTPLFYGAQSQGCKEMCSDDDGLFIDEVIAHLPKFGLKSATNEYTILKLFYFGLKSEVDDPIRESLTKTRIEKKVVVKPQSMRQISKLTGLTRAKIAELKNSGESCVRGMIAMKTMMTGQKLGLLENIKLF